MYVKISWIIDKKYDTKDTIFFSFTSIIIDGVTASKSRNNEWMKENYHNIMKNNKTIMEKKRKRKTMKNTKEITIEIFPKRKRERQGIIKQISRENYQKKKIKQWEYCPNYYKKL